MNLSRSDSRSDGVVGSVSVSGNLSGRRKRDGEANEMSARLISQDGGSDPDIERQMKFTGSFDGSGALCRVSQ